MESLKEVWNGVCAYLKTQMNEVTFNTWIAPLSLSALSGDEVTLYIRTDFQRDIILQHYQEQLKNAFEKILNFPVHISIQTEEDLPVSPLSVDSSASQYEYTFATFIVGASNRFAHAAAMAVAENPAVTYNPLFIYGNSGLGKTHLLNAIYNRVNQKFPQKTVWSVNCETFANEFYYALEHGTLNKFRDKYRGADVLLIDDVQFIAGKESTQEEFFNTFNSLYMDQKQIVVTSDRPPKDIATLDERIRTRFEAGLIADIQPPEFETRVSIIKRKAQLLKFDLSDDIIYYIAEQLKSNIRQLEGVVKKLQAQTLLSSEPLTPGAVQTAIRDIRNDDMPEPVTVGRIISEVARTYTVSADDILSKKQDANISHARQVAMYIVREVTQMPYDAIGENFGGKHHSTVLYNVRNIKKLIDKNSKEKALISDIIKNLENN